MRHHIRRLLIVPASFEALQLGSAGSLVCKHMEFPGAADCHRCLVQRFLCKISANGMEGSEGHNLDVMLRDLDDDTLLA